MKYPDVRKLYKYRSLRVVHGSRSVRDKKLIESISSQAIWMPNPDSFNDPFDCNVRPIALGRIFEKRHSEAFKKSLNAERLKKVMQQNGVNMDIKNISHLVSILKKPNDNFDYKSISRDQIENQLWEEIRKKIGTLGVLSLSEISDHPLLWSHYADQHRGFCIEFDRTPRNKLGDSSTTFPVRYSNKYPQITMDELYFHKSSNQLTLDHSFIGSILLTKSECWSYESEWRWIGIGNNMLTSYPGKITAIIFGLRMPKADRNLLKKLYGQNVQFKETLLSEDQFSLTISDIEG